MTKKRIKWLQLIALILAAEMNFFLPYLQSTFYLPLKEALGFSNTQLGLVAGVYGAVAMVMYALGGILADRISTRVLITFSLITGGISGFYFATYPSFLGGLRKGSEAAGIKR